MELQISPEYKSMIAIGNILMAFEVFKDLQFQYDKESAYHKKRVEEANRDYRSFGMFEDCGDSYEASKYAAEQTQATMTSYLHAQVARKEKYFKKLKFDFLENFPEKELLLTSLIEERRIVIQQYHQEKIAKNNHK